MVRGGLFSRFFLEDGIRQTDSYQMLDPAEVRTFGTAIRGLWADLETMRRPSEAETEGEFIFPAFDLLGWHHLTQQEPGRGRRDVADALLFLNASAKAAARKLVGPERFKLGVMVVENEARETKLDRGSGSGEAPSSQILRYLSRADFQSDGAVRWGLLTNGRFWRLYWSQARARAEGFIEFDLPALVSPLPPPTPPGAPGDHWLRTFFLLFRATALQPQSPSNRTFLDEALAEGRRYEERVTATLSEAVFDRVFPDLVKAVANYDPAALVNDAAWRIEAREAALRLLFRLLFLLYAEDRDLLPVHHPGYAEYSLRKLRDEAAASVDEHKVLSNHARVWWPQLRALFGAVADGDTSMGLPPYNGALFRDEVGSLMQRLSLPDAVLVPLLDTMSREGPPGARRWINYRDLSVQHLGSIYEGLLERDVAPDNQGGVTLQLNPFARKASGSYYTSDELVRLILRRSVGPLLAERRAHFAHKADFLANETGTKADRIGALTAHDPAEQFLNLRICDPAMGSGHFLVSLVDFLADETLSVMADASATIDWATYKSPLAGRISAIRAHILAQAAASGWHVPEAQLDDRHIIRRIILKRCVFGVDLNPMAVELAKLSLWLHSFTVGAPLSFLDHHLRCGDSLFGEFTGPVEADLRKRFGLVMSGAIVQARNAAAGMAIVEEQTDADIPGVAASAAGFEAVEQDTADLRAFLSMYQASRWLPPDRNTAAKVGRDMLFGGGYGDPVAIAHGAPMAIPKPGAADIKGKGRRPPVPAVDAHQSAAAFVTKARALAAERRFFHWEAAFPGVWNDWEREHPPGGFHAVIGNPPWDRMKMQEVEWFAARVPNVAHVTRAADRKRAVQALRDAADPIATEYDAAAWTAEAASRVARECDAYPLLSGGDINIYSLMVERAARLVRPDGIVGVVVPSGIAADLGAAQFFRSLSTTGRLSALLDFENRRSKLSLEPFFPDVDSRFKFSALVFGGRKRTFPQADCAFFQTSAEAAERDAFPLAPADFAAVNPNTGTAPVFRTQRDAAITLAIYGRLPVLVDRTGPTPERVWPVRFATMFHMTSDSGLFQTEKELRALGAYEVAGRIWKRNLQAWVPLFEGKMVQAYDHRAASVVVNPENLHRLGPPEDATLAQHADPAWSAKPQFWIEAGAPEWPKTVPAILAFKDVTSATNMRTMIAALIPAAPAGNTLPVLLPAGGNDLPGDLLAYIACLPLLLGNLNSMVLDFVARTKVQALHLNSYIIEQLPVVPRQGFEHRFGPRTAAEIVREDVLRLTCTAHDIGPIAAEFGHVGPPFPWDPEDRLRRRARLDAVFFHLYGVGHDDADYVMSTFPNIANRERESYGRFRSRDLVLAYMSALAAGDPNAPVVG